MSRIPGTGNRELMSVALGEAAADLAIINGDILNVYTGEILSGDTVLVKGDRIAYVGKNGANGIGASTRVIDAAGKTVIPGFIDSHTHIACEYSIAEVLKYAITGGVTTIVSEVSEMAFSMGYAGIIEFLRSVKDQPVKVFVAVPPMVTFSPADAAHAVTVKELRMLFRHKAVIGLGESYWAPVVGGDKRVLELIAETVRAGKLAWGHSSGARENKLQAYIDTGVASCHEPITADEALERLRLGLAVLIREGEIRKDLEAIAPLKDRNLDLRRLAVATDGIGPWQLMKDGFLEFVVQKAINLGFNPVTAIQMATINPAQHLGLDRLTGGIAPGRCADILVIPDIRTVRPEYVISNGQVVSRGGKMLVPPRAHRYSRAAGESIRLPRKLVPADFIIKAERADGPARVRVIDQITSLVTKEVVLDIPVTGGQVSADPARDIIKIAALERRFQTGNIFVGFIRGTGLRGGAIALSCTWDSSNLIAVGDNDADMAGAVNRLHDLRGGMVVYSGGKALAELAMPVGGHISREPMETISRKLEEVQEAAARLGCVSPDVRITLATHTSSAIAHFRICEEGLFSLRENRFLDLFVD